MSRILVVDDVSANLNLLTELLEVRGHEVLAAPSGRIALEILSGIEVDLILLDIMMPELDGIDTCKAILAAVAQPPPIIFISASDRHSQLGEAFDVGGVDYITKPFRNSEVLARVDNQLRIHQLQGDLQQRNAELEAQIARTNSAEQALSIASETLSLISRQEAAHWGLPAFIGNSEQFCSIAEQIRQLQGFAQTNVVVLGESGSGKELVARALHFGSELQDRPFIAINCSAISEQLAEAEFFGSVKGAFTGANTNRKGFFELADGGTLFLDEVGDLPLNLQAKLLRTLEDGSFYPVGGQCERRVKVRVISATNNDLDSKISQKAFREDLYFRLAQFSLRVPPLRERRADISLLAGHFALAFAQEMKTSSRSISEAAMSKLRAYHFPGNIRELKNIMERAIILSHGVIDAEHIQFSSALAQAPRSVSDELTSLSLKDVKTQLADTALRQCEGNITAAAKLLGVHRSWFYRQE
ncbi:sigma-54-dependent transcriptional regulator [Zhongshania sp.]|uniref:sigma-54-dependent transcriptional regulator n=1 Tax=Zhongshania sp. TaxID=1971902 RepID=UPI0035663396